MKVWLGQGDNWAHLTHLTTCLWMVAALIQTGEVNLTQWVKYVPCRGQYAQSRQRRMRRWLGNPRINVHRLYKPIIQAALATWEDPCLYVSLDTTQFWDEYCLIRLPSRCPSGASATASLAGAGAWKCLSGFL